jgi:hypothetical protein
MGRFAAVTDRLDIMLFAVMSTSPVPQAEDGLGRAWSSCRDLSFIA